MRNYAFCFSAEILSPLPFNEIPVEEICAAIRERLEKACAENNREAFECFDEFDEDEPKPEAGDD